MQSNFLQHLYSKNAIYYVYRHIRPDKNIPFYIGIGKGRRCWYRSGRNEIWNRIVSKNNGAFEYEILSSELTIQQAYEKEKEFISLYGRLNLGSGSLANMTSGGDGCSGMSDETKGKISKANTGKVRTDEVKQKLGKHRIGKKQSELTRSKIADSNRRRKGKELVYWTTENRIARGKTVKNELNGNYKGAIWALDEFNLTRVKPLKNPAEIRQFLSKPIDFNLATIYKLCRGEKPGSAYGFKWLRDDVLKNGIPLILYKKRVYKTKKIYNTITKEIYNGIREASAATGYSNQLLRERLSGRRKNNTHLVYVQ